MPKVRRTSYEKHGLSYSPLCGVWRDMVSRCYNESNKYYHNYGGRGIIVCNEWLNSLATFYEDMNKGYERGLEIDRIDNNKGYSRENCKWVTRSVNGANRRSVGKHLKGTKKIGNKFSATIKVNQKSYHIGMFDTEEMAHKEYLIMHKEWFGF